MTVCKVSGPVTFGWSGRRRTFLPRRCRSSGAVCSVTMRAISLSLTHCFSWVEEWPKQQQPFQRFPHADETVETVPSFCGSSFTQLKQGVNERCLGDAG